MGVEVLLKEWPVIQKMLKFGMYYDAAKPFADAVTGTISLEVNQSILASKNGNTEIGINVLVIFNCTI